MIVKQSTRGPLKRIPMTAVIINFCPKAV